MKQLILGGVRSGKSKLAEQAAAESGLKVLYVATATQEDAEMQARVEKHRERRPGDWRTIEEPIHLAQCLQEHAANGTCVLVDCLTLWLTNLLLKEDEDLLRTQIHALLKIVPSLPGEIIFVSNETGMGVVPLGELTRRYCDEAGLLHQVLAEQCDQVMLTVAGLPMIIKGEK
jgi:adenosylcobinamide kinase/adenosylcobinamide-phosphate guanylyltransferase